MGICKCSIRRKTMKNSRLDRLKSYMELCDVHTNKELMDVGYTHSVQYLGQVLNGQKNLSADEEMLIYNCINKARAKRLIGE